MKKELKQVLEINAGDIFTTENIHIRELLEALDELHDGLLGDAVGLRVWDDELGEELLYMDAGFMDGEYLYDELLDLDLLVKDIEYTDDFYNGIDRDETDYVYKNGYTITINKEGE